MEQLGLKTADENDMIALRGVRLYSYLVGMSQRTTIEQTFVNQEDKAIEAVYTFPLPTSAAVCDFEVVSSDRVLTGKIEEMDKAIDEYEQAVSEGHGGFMLEQERPDVFTVVVGNLKPNQAVTIRLTYVTDLDINDGSIRIAFPTTVAPRYVTSTGTDPIQASLDAEALNPPHVLHVAYGLSMEVDVALGYKFKAIKSPSHDIEVDEKDEAQYVVTLSSDLTAMDRDIVLELTPGRQTEPQAQIESAPDGESFVAVTFIPEFDVEPNAEPSPSEVVFVLDCSGSMHGQSIADAKAALGLCLRGLNSGDMFNICRFGSTHELMAPKPLVYGDRTFKKAMRYLGGVEADLGGTELLSPLQDVLATPMKVDGVRDVILLTDGEVSNEDAIIRLARGHRNTTRIFTFGIGPACSAHLVRGLARATGGAAEFITYGESVEPKVLRTFSRLASPMVTDVVTDWHDAEVALAPEILPPLFDGDVLRVFARSSGPLPEKVTLSCNTSAGSRSWEVDLKNAQQNGQGISVLWARQCIQDLEDAVLRDRWHAKRRGDSQIIALSKEFNLVCSQTAFLAIEHRSVEERNAGQPELRRIPTKLATGWHGIVGSSTHSLGARPVRFCLAYPESVVTCKLMAGPAMKAEEMRALQNTIKRTSASQDGDDSSLFDGSAGPSAHPVVLRLLNTQAAGGYFEPEAKLSTITGLELRPIKSIIGEALESFDCVHSSNDKDRILRCALCLVLLRIHFSAYRDLWHRAYNKGCRFLAIACEWTGDQVSELLDDLVERVSDDD